MSLSTAKQTINEAVSRLVGAIEGKRASGETTLDVLSLMQCVTLEVISRHAFNATAQEAADLYEEDSKLRLMTTQFMKMHSPEVALQMTSYFPFLEQVAIFAYKLFGGGQLIDHLVEHISRCLVEYYQTRIQERFSPPTEEGPKREEANRPKKVNLLDYMLEQQEKGALNEMELMGNAIITLIAGFETSSSALTFTLYLLAKHPHIQEKLRAEIKAEMETNSPKDSTNFCHFDGNRCELLDRVWYESLRLYPPVVTFITRELDDQHDEQGVVLTKSGVRITKEMVVQVPTWTIHHSAQYWEDPLAFNPYRDGLPIPGSGQTNPAFLPYGAGQRSCLGYKLADSEARAVLTAILSSYRVELASIVDDEEAVDEATGLLKLACKTVFIRPERKIHLKFTPL